jgi:hypothetical protein
MARRSGRNGGGRRASRHGRRREDSGRAGRRSGRSRDDEDDDREERGRGYGAPSGGNTNLIIGAVVGALVLIVIIAFAVGGSSGRGRGTGKRRKKERVMRISPQHYQVYWHNEGLKTGSKWHNNYGRRTPTAQELDALINRYAVEDDVPAEFMADYREGFKKGTEFKD